MRAGGDVAQDWAWRLQGGVEILLRVTSTPTANRALKLAGARCCVGNTRVRLFVTAGLAKLAL